jgi:hypothetical protein
VIHRWQVVGKIGEGELVAAPYTASGDGVYVRAADYDALAARLAEAERVLKCIEIAPTTAEIAIAGYFKRHTDSA